MATNNVAVDSGGQGLVVGVAGEIAIFEHLKPGISLLGSWDDTFGKGLSESWTRAATLVSLVLEIELESLPYRFECKFKPLDRGVANEFTFGLSDGLGQSSRALACIDFPLDKSFFAHEVIWILLYLTRDNKRRLDLKVA